MLEQAGVRLTAIPATIDEQVEKRLHDQPAALAQALAVRKAEQVSAEQGDSWVVGSDSVASVDGVRFDKPANREDAAEHLRAFSGNMLHLTSAVALARRGTADWHACETALLAVRPLSAAFIAEYLDCEWPAIGHCAGAFRLEGMGVQLFERIDGNYFTILGMPLLPLLGALRNRGVIGS